MFSLLSSTHTASRNGLPIDAFSCVEYGGRMFWGKCELRVRVEIMGPGKYEHVGKSQSVLIMINPIIFTRTRSRTEHMHRHVPVYAQRLLRHA